MTILKSTKCVTRVFLQTNKRSYYSFSRYCAWLCRPFLLISLTILLITRSFYLLITYNNNNTYRLRLLALYGTMTSLSKMANFCHLSYVFRGYFQAALLMNVMQFPLFDCFASLFLFGLLSVALLSKNCMLVILYSILYLQLAFDFFY